MNNMSIRQCHRLVGWRGMVGSLIDRMQDEGDFELIEPVFRLHRGEKAPFQAKTKPHPKDAFDIDALKKCDIITAQAVTTRQKFSLLQAAGWQSWIDGPLPFG
jgi:aspartate-semialdehyde dehydrogenase